MDPQALLRQVTDQLRPLAEDAVRGLVGQLPVLGDEPSAAGTVLAGRLLVALDKLPPGNSLVELLREMLGDLENGSPVRLHGWRRAPEAPIGVALVLTDLAGRAVLGVTPGGPVFDVVVTPGSNVALPPRTNGPWTVRAAVAAPSGWDTGFGPGLPPAPPGGTATITAERAGRLAAGMTDGPGISVEGVGITVGSDPATPVRVAVELRGLTAAVLPAPLAKMVGLGLASPITNPVTAIVLADRAGGLRFGGGVRMDLPLRFGGPDLGGRGAALELRSDGGLPRLGLSGSLTARLPGLPLRAALDGAGIELPVALSPASRPGLDPRGLRELFPDGVAAELDLPPVSGGGALRSTGDQGYGGVISVDLGVLRTRAFALFRPPIGGAPTSFLVMLAADFPAPGLELGLGFAMDAVGGMVGLNRRVDVTALERLVRDGNTDRVLFPDNAAARAGEIVGALSAVFPVAPGRMLIAPMVRINWGGRMVSLAGALVLEAPAPVRAVLVGRLLVSVPDPVVPLVRLQASVLGKIDPGVPVVELLVSLAGSWIVGLAVRGELYLLVRGGAQPQFVLSAGGFHPRYTRPAGVPALRRLQIDLAPGGSFGMRMEAYFAVTSNAVMFGGQVQLEAMIAGCGVQGWLGLDALFVFDPVFAFSVRVRAGVAVRAFGRRLAGVALDFTLEGPAPWHAFGTGSISVLFWDVDLDFDIRWGSPPAILPQPGRDPGIPVGEAVARVEAWAVQRPTQERTALVFTDDAAGRIRSGAIVHPDSTLRFSQKVVPLGVPITRFERRPVPAQTWTIAAVTVAVPRDLTKRTPLTERFVPGEFFDFNEEQKLSQPAFTSYASGVPVDTDGARVAPGHLVDDEYETSYEPPLTREWLRWPGLLAHESVHRVSPAERLNRWRPRSVTVPLRRPTLTAAAPDTLHPLLTDVSLVNATADAWETVRERVGDVPVRLVESWEASS